MPAIAQQFDLITNDPRCEPGHGVFSELVAFYKASREHHGLLSQSQAARILGVATGQIGSWITRGRLSSAVVADVRMVSAGEVLALLKERQEEIRKSGGRGHKAPSLSDLVESAYSDIIEE